MTVRDPEAGKNLGLPNGSCSRGWGNRCPASKGPKCRCSCGGANHGKARTALEAGAPEQLPLDERDSSAYPDDATDVWWCSEHGEWTVPSRPHDPKCPHCGARGWWRRFASALAKAEGP